MLAPQVGEEGNTVFSPELCHFSEWMRIVALKRVAALSCHWLELAVEAYFVSMPDADEIFKF